MNKSLVIIESPFAGDLSGNHEYWKKCMEDSIHRGEAPFSSHFFYTQVLSDLIPTDRILGIDLGFQWMRRADLVAFYCDKGMSRGMIESMKRCEFLGINYEIRNIYVKEVAKPS